MNTQRPAGNESIFSSFFADDDNTVMEIYNKFGKDMNELLNSPEYTTERYMRIYRARESYYRDHYAIINRRCDTL